MNIFTKNDARIWQLIQLREITQQRKGDIYGMAQKLFWSAKQGRKLY